MAILGRSALGLDLGSHQIKAVELRHTLRGIEVGGVHVMPTEDPDDPRPRSERLRSFLRSHKLPTDHVVCALPGDRITGRRLRLPFRDRRKLSQAVPLEVEDDLPLDAENLVVDWELVGGDKREAEVAANVAPRIEVARLLDLLGEADASPRVVEAEGLVLGNLSLWFPLDGVQLVVDLGHRKTTLCLCIEGEPLAARTVPLGGRALTEALARDRGVDLREAERIKCEEGVAPGGAGAASQVLDRIAREIVRTLGSFEPVLVEFGAARVDGLTLIGGGAHLPGVEAWLGERVGVPAARLSPPDDEAGRTFLASGDPALFGPAAALSLRGSLRARTRTNFRQDEFAVRFDVAQLGRELVWPGVMAGVALLLAAGVATTSIVLQSRRADGLERQMTQLYREAFPGDRAPGNLVGAMRGAVGQAQERADFLGVYRGNLSALDLLTEISALIPQDLQVTFEELAIDRQVVRIRGHSTSFEAVDQLRTELSRFAPFSQIKVSEITSGRGGEGKSFSVTISMAATDGTT
jgi:general secretion pathway protein L